MRILQKYEKRHARRNVLEGGAERWKGRLNPVRIVVGKPKSEGLDDGNKGSLSFVRAAINQLYLVRRGSSQNEVQ